MQRLTPTVFKAFLTELMTMMRIQHVSSSNANLLYIYHKYPNNLNYISIIIYFACAFGQLRINLLPICIGVESRNRQLFSFIFPFVDIGGNGNVETFRLRLRKSECPGPGPPFFHPAWLGPLHACLVREASGPAR